MGGNSRPGRTGLWLIGARGSVATTAIVGLAALRSGLVRPTGCVTELPAFGSAPLPGWDDIVVGGHDISVADLHKTADTLVAAGLLPAGVVSAAGSQLSTVESELRPGYDPATQQGDQAHAVTRLAGDMSAFARRHDLERVVVVNVASTESPWPEGAELQDLAALESALSEGTVPASVVAAYAAVQADCAYVEFTPSTGITIPALRKLAEQRGLPYAGRDGKTGETLLRTVLAPMFTERALAVRSWSGTNLLGGGDGATLADPDVVASKLDAKSRGLHALLGGEVAAPLHIDNVPDLGQTKVAWDHVHAEGFLGSPATLQVTWSAYDSALAAPLVLDLTRLVAMAQHAGQRGPLTALACFFKEPFGSGGHRFDHQVRGLHEWVRVTTDAAGGGR
ncbi:inositol-3-phosphate synthase [Saccharopolyspora gloriosae]|uniref:inositol-3-phosphate synthase n=1 Tax=Saccharopolyspora gloriosae TaxID=455344 RepID=UPI001FB8163D|nr:inositol-3-phosphate synthase [Saccharopolyspora gloriosae]